MIVYAFKSGKYVLLLQLMLVIALGGNMNQISYKIKALRELNGLKQSDLARALNVSVLAMPRSFREPWPLALLMQGLPEIGRAHV